MGRAKRVPSSPLADALERVGDRWTLLLVAALLDGPKRFNELQEELEGIAPNVLSAPASSRPDSESSYANRGGRSE